MTEKLKIFFSSDIHGSEKCFRKFLNAAKFYDAQVLIMGGDITGKAMVPLVSRPNNMYEFTYLGASQVIGASELDEIEKRIRFNGFYPYRCDQDELERIASDKDYFEALFERLMAQTLEDWLALAQERLSGTNVRCYIMAGNDDGFFVDEVLARSRSVCNPDDVVVDVGDFQMVSTSYVPFTPWHSPRECSEEELQARIEHLLDQVNPQREIIFNLHCPPYRSKLDTAPELRSDLSVVMEGGQPRLIPVGSHAVRTLIERVQPLLALHGHIHESRGMVHIGRTTCVNPGSTYGDGSLDGALVTLTHRGVQACQLIRG